MERQRITWFCSVGARCRLEIETLRIDIGLEDRAVDQICHCGQHMDFQKVRHNGVLPVAFRVHVVHVRVLKQDDGSPVLAIAVVVEKAGGNLLAARVGARSRSIVTNNLQTSTFPQ